MPGWAACRLPARTASAMTQARRRLGPGPLRELFFLLRGPSPQADVTDPESVQSVVEQAERGLGGLDVWINKAGIFPTCRCWTPMNSCGTRSTA